MRLYYRRATAEEVDAMLACAAPLMKGLEKDRWIQRAKANHAATIRMAFLMGDKDGDGMLSLAEFADAVALHRGEKPQQVAGVHGTASTGGAAQPVPPAEPISQEELARVFAAGDKDGNGQLDLCEFLSLVASHPKLMESFETILELGIQKRRKAEQDKLNLLFRCAVSPSSRGIASPSGARRRPTLADLKQRHEVVLPDDWNR